MKKIIRCILPMVFVVTLLMGECVTYGKELIEQSKKVKDKVYIAVIIDDFGNQMAGTVDMTRLTIPITGAVIPGMPFAKEDAKKLHDAGKEVILHVPLEALNGKPNWLGPKGITVGMSKDKIKEILESALEEIPYAVGMNNHMGSRAMQDKKIVSTLMEFANEKKFYFVDSKTYNTKIADEVAKEKHTTYMVRDVFLDHIPTTEYATKQLQEALKIAKEKGYAIVIGHVGPQKGPVTLAALKAMIPKLQAENVEFVTVSTLIERLQAQ